MSYDTHCWDLAEGFLDDYTVVIGTRADAIGRLAQGIQDEIDGELALMRRHKIIVEGPAETHARRDEVP